MIQKIMFILVFAKNYTTILFPMPLENDLLSPSIVLSSKALRLPIFDFGKTQLYVPISLSDVPLNLLIDLSSSVSWVESSKCLGCRPWSRKVNMESKNIVMPRFESINNSLSQLEGFYLDVDTQIRTIDENYFNVGKTTFMIIENLRGLQYLQTDGVLGLDYNRGKNDFIDTLYKNKVISERRFSIYNEKAEDTPSELIIGAELLGMLSTAGYMKILAIRESKLWGFQARAIKVNGSSALLKKPKVFINSGLDGIKLPLEVYNILIKELEKNNLMCRRLSKYLECLYMNFFGILRPILITISIDDDREIIFNTEGIFKEKDGPFIGVQYIGLILISENDEVELGVSFFSQYNANFDYSDHSIHVLSLNAIAQRRLKDVKLEINVLNIIFVLILGVLTSHLFLLGVKAYQEYGTHVNYFEIGIFD